MLATRNGSQFRTPITIGSAAIAPFELALPVGSGAMVRVDSEVGPLRSVLLHRPGKELKRLTPRNNDQLLFDGLPWVGRAQEEHDAFAELLRARGIEVLLLGELLATALEDERARATGIDSAVHERRIGIDLADVLRSHLAGLKPADLAEVLMGGMTFEELPAAEGASLVRRMHQPADFVIEPLPNLLFTRDSSAWVGDRVAIASLVLPARIRESTITDLIYAYHPRFATSARAYGAHSAPIEGGDVLLLAPGVVAIGVGERTTPAGAESFARSVLRDGLAHTVLAIPIQQQRASMHLDTVCTMVDTDAVVMYPAIQEQLCAYPLRPSGDGTRVEGPVPFLDAAAEAMGIERLRSIDTGLDPVTAEREQWDDGNNMLALAPGVVVGYERNTETNARLAEAGLEVLPISGSELGSGRGGPRCMSCPLDRAPI